MAKKFNHNVGVYNDQSALEIVPILMDKFNPKSVIDIGCGIGNFLKIFSQYGVNEILGIDGDWVDKELLIQNIPEEKFKKIDLNTEFKSFVKDYSYKYDLLISLEVAEHLAPATAQDFISCLCGLSDNIIFSAAIPFQGGENHVNEQWPSYWIELFKSNGFVCNNFMRPLIWNNTNIHWWYRQNMLYFKRNVELIDQPVNADISLYNIVHPDLYLANAKWSSDFTIGKFALGYYFMIFKKIFLRKIK